MDNQNETRRTHTIFGDPIPNASAKPQRKARMTKAQRIDIQTEIAMLQHENAKLRAAQAAPAPVEVKPVIVKRAARKAQAPAQGSKPVIGFTYQGKNPNQLVSQADAKYQARIAYVLAGYGLTVKPGMTRLDYAQACAAQKAQGNKWNPRRMGAPHAAPKVEAVKAQPKAQARAHASASIAPKPELKAAFVELGRALGLLA